MKPLLLALLAALALAGRAVADTPAPPSGPLLPDDELKQILGEDEKTKEGDDHKAESWLKFSDGDVKLLNDEFKPRNAKSGNAYQRAHHEAHELLDKYKDQKLPLDQLKQGVSDIVYGVRSVIATGVDYAKVKREPGLTDDARKAKVAEVQQKMNEARSQLAAVPVPGGANANLALINGTFDDKGEARPKSAFFWIERRVDRDGFKKEVAKNRADPSLQVEEGNAALSENDPKAAKQAFDNALSLDPSNGDALSGRAAANVDLGNMHDAAQDARDALAINPDDPAAKAVLALAHDTAAGDTRINKENLFKSADGGDGPSAAGGGAARGLPGVSESNLKYLAPSDGAGLQSSAYTREALRALKLGDADTALKHADRAVSLDAKNPDAFGLRAFANAKLGRYEAALKDAVAALALDPSNTMAHNARAKALNKMGLYHEALAAADDALRADPKNAYAYYMRAMALQALGERKAMVAALGAAAALDPRYQDAYDLAKSAPDEKDMAFLFPEEQLFAAKAALAASKTAPRRIAGLPVWAWSGIGILALLALRWLMGTVLPKMRAGYAAAVRTGPSVGAAETSASLPIPPPLGTPGGWTLTQTGAILRGQYRRLGQIGSSVHGAVYEGLDLSLQRPVAIRKLRADMRAADRERLMAPARAAAALNHGGIAPVYAVFEEGPALYLVSEWAPGRSLRDTLASSGPLPWEQAQPLFRQVAAAVDYARARGVTHGAIKASNVMIAQDGRVKLIDYGLARGAADPAADLNAYAACLREAIAGLPPARLDAVDAALRQARASAQTAADVLAAVEAGLASAA